MDISLYGFSCDPPERSDTPDRPYSPTIISLDAASSETDQYRRAYWNMLVEYIPRSGWRPPQDGKLTVLDLGCGDAYYAVAAKAYFGRGENYLRDQSKKVRYFGVDISPEEIASSKKRYGRRSDYQFIAGDARDLARFPQIPNQVDLEIFRHPVVSEPQTWRAIFLAGRKKLKSGGIMIFTTYLEGEHKILLSLLKDVPGIKVEIAEINRRSSCGNAIFCNDRYLVIARAVNN